MLPAVLLMEKVTLSLKTWRADCERERETKEGVELCLRESRWRRMGELVLDSRYETALAEAARSRIGRSFILSVYMMVERLTRAWWEIFLPKAGRSVGVPELVDVFTNARRHWQASDTHQTDTP
jgi:hypothetical protein